MARRTTPGPRSTRYGVSFTTTATHGPDRSGIGPGVPVPSRTTFVIGDDLYSDCGNALDADISSSTDASTNGRSPLPRRFATIPHPPRDTQARRAVPPAGMLGTS